MVFGDGQSNSVIQIYPGLSVVAMATKFETKWATARFLLEISARSLHLQGGFRGWAIEYCQQNFTLTDPCCHGNKIWDKKAIIRLL